MQNKIDDHQPRLHDSAERCVVNGHSHAAMLITLDWGTTHLRATLLAADGRVIETRERCDGVLSLARADFPAAYRAALADWLALDPAVPVIAAGMVGSVNGWQAVDYLDCPLPLDDLAGRLTRVGGLDDTRDVWIVPGLAGNSPAGNPDVMRGEEAQVVGAAEGTTRAVDGLYCLPGTHVKWVSVRDNAIQTFATSMTGDVFAALRRYSILADDSPADDDSEFGAGLDQAGRAGGLLHHLFSTRAGQLIGGLRPDAAPAYLSGVLIGHDARAMLNVFNARGAIKVVGGRSLAPWYVRAIEHLGGSAESVDGDEAAQRGLFRLAARAGLVQAAV